MSALVARDSRGQTLGTFGQMLGLLARESTDHVHSSAAPADPKPQESLAARLVELELVRQAFGPEIAKGEGFVEKVQRHSTSVGQHHMVLPAGYTPPVPMHGRTLRTCRGLDIGGALLPPPPEFTADAELIQEALLERRTATPRPLLQRIAAVAWRWC